MSEPGDGHRDWRFHVEDMIGFGERVLDYAAGLNKAEFLASPTLPDIELIGEAARRHIPTAEH